MTILFVSHRKQSINLHRKSVEWFPMTVTKFVTKNCDQICSTKTKTGFKIKYLVQSCKSMK